VGPGHHRGGRHPVGGGPHHDLPALARSAPSAGRGAERDPDIADLQRAFAQERRQATRRAIERAAARGEIPSDVDVQVEASLIAGPLFYRRMVSREPLSEAFVDKIVSAACARLGAP
jgi:hypothetical protein